MMTLEKRRDSNIELYRIVLMLLIVAHHYVVNSGLMGEMGKQAFSSRSIFYYLFGAWGKVGINCFVLITGYFMCRSKISVRKFLKLVLEIVFYSVTINLIFTLTGYRSFSGKQLLLSFFPVRSISEDFVSCYLVFFLLIPFLNLFLTALNRSVHYVLILVLAGIYTVLPTFLFVEVHLNYVTWFIVIYLIGAYIRLYEPERLKYQVGGKLFLLLMLSIASVIVLTFLHDHTPFGIPVYHFLNDANKLLALLVAIYAFLFFMNLEIGYHKWINTIASATFGVLLIHANSDTMRSWLWGDLLKNTTMFSKPWGAAVLHAVISVLVVFAICILIDLLRIRLLERPFFKWYDRNEGDFAARVKPMISRIVSIP